MATYDTNGFKAAYDAMDVGAYDRAITIVTDALAAFAAQKESGVITTGENDDAAPSVGASGVGDDDKAVRKRRRQALKLLRRNVCVAYTIRACAYNCGYRCTRVQCPSCAAPSGSECTPVD